MPGEPSLEGLIMNRPRPGGVARAPRVRERFGGAPVDQLVIICPSASVNDNLEERMSSSEFGRPPQIRSAHLRDHRMLHTRYHVQPGDDFGSESGCRRSASGEVLRIQPRAGD